MLHRRGFSTLPRVGNNPGFIIHGPAMFSMWQLFGDAPRDILSIAPRGMLAALPRKARLGAFRVPLFDACRTRISARMWLEVTERGDVNPSAEGHPELSMILI